MPGLAERLDCEAVRLKASAVVGLAGLLNAVIGVVDRQLGREVLAASRLAFAAFTLLVVLLPLRRVPSVRASLGWVAVTVAASLPVMALSAHELATRPGSHNDPMIGPRFAVVYAAMLVPGPLWFARACVALYAATGFVTALVLGRGPGVRFDDRDPWLSLAVLLVAAGILHLRGRVARLEGSLLGARERERSRRRLIRLARALADETGNALQTIGLSAAVLAARFPEAERPTRRIRTAAARLDETLRPLRAFFAEEGPLELDARRELDELRVPSRPPPQGPVPPSVTH